MEESYESYYFSFLSGDTWRPGFYLQCLLMDHNCVSNSSSSPIHEILIHGYLKVWFFHRQIHHIGMSGINLYSYLYIVVYVSLRGTGEQIQSATFQVTLGLSNRVAWYLPHLPQVGPGATFCFGRDSAWCGICTNVGYPWVNFSCSYNRSQGATNALRHRGRPSGIRSSYFKKYTTVPFMLP